MTWVVIVWCVLRAVLIASAIASASPDDNCVHHAYISHRNCVNASNAGTGIGVVILWFVWFFGFIPLSLIWFMTRPKGRECPVCGEHVKKGHAVCGGCGHDFAAAAAAAQVNPAPEQLT